MYHSRNKIDDTYLPYIEGKDVKRYFLTWSGEYIKYGPNLAAMRDPMIFSKPRILVRQIPNKSDYAIDGIYVEKRVINDLNSMVITNIQNISPLVLLGFINSKPMTLWFLMRFDKFQRRLFPQFKVNELGQFPLPDIGTEIQNNIESLVKIIMQKAKNNDDYSKENTKVDELVMTAFGLDEKEKETVRKFEF
ncbi:TaqI-like C-terminal specificity domain-containing protein [Lactobacillus helveticus]|uniref:TaqI-like C-terminal specificity domain-containing protein n=1 Tax=Lactobacillus helveticus TaxID=1587 RepID=UPI00287FFD12|nr:TaqI-like C-terminal specificity domain-containing protein [Lactobacillus helveticus]